MPPAGANKLNKLNALQQPIKLDSIAVSLSTNSETAAATPLGVMRNFQLASTFSASALRGLRHLSRYQTARSKYLF